MKIFVNLSSFSNLVKPKITSLGVNLSVSLIRELMKVNSDTSKDEIFAMNYWYATATFASLSYYLALSLEDYLGISLISTL